MVLYLSVFFVLGNVKSINQIKFSVPGENKLTDRRIKKYLRIICFMFYIWLMGVFRELTSVQLISN